LKKSRKNKSYIDVKIVSKKAAAIALSIFSVLSCVLAVLGYLYIRHTFKDPSVVRDWISEHFVLGVIAMILICAIQVIVALVPGELVEIAAGYIFGVWFGSLICFIGIMLGSVTVILLTRKIGRRFIEALCPREKLESLPVINDPKKRDSLAAILFLIPGTPKDLLTYIIALTQMSIPTYILLTSVRFPSIIISAMGGDALINENLTKAIWIFIVAAVISSLGYFLFLMIKKGKENKKHKK
jgi:uncharacterized membrane protein YdjX (TVP38/TMEM64 family)